jgi:hypothetical protein
MLEYVGIHLSWALAVLEDFMIWWPSWRPLVNHSGDRIFQVCLVLRSTRSWNQTERTNRPTVFAALLWTTKAPVVCSPSSRRDGSMVRYGKHPSPTRPTMNIHELCDDWWLVRVWPPVVPGCGAPIAGPSPTTLRWFPVQMHRCTSCWSCTRALMQRENDLPFENETWQISSSSFLQVSNIPCGIPWYSMFFPCFFLTGWSQRLGNLEAEVRAKIQETWGTWGWEWMISCASQAIT